MQFTASGASSGQRIHTIVIENTVKPTAQQTKLVPAKLTLGDILDNEAPRLQATLLLRRHSDGALGCTWARCPADDYGDVDDEDIDSVAFGGEYGNGGESVIDTTFSDDEYAQKLLFTAEVMLGAPDLSAPSGADGPFFLWPPAVAHLNPRWYQMDNGTESPTKKQLLEMLATALISWT